VGDTLCAGEKEEVEWAYKIIESELKIERQGKLKKHLGIWYNWKKDKTGKTFLEAYMPKMVKEICEKYQQATGKRAKNFSTPGAPGKTLKKKKGKMKHIDSYRSIVGKIMYYATKIVPHICNAIRELACHLSNPGEEH
jgi:hypothetical protein